MIYINNKKGFTLVELLAVIVIISMLTMLAIPSITRYMETSKKKLFAENAIRAINAVKEYELKEEFLTSANSNITPECSDIICYYDISQINALLDKKLDNSPFGSTYNTDISNISSEKNTANGKETRIYKMCLIDADNNGFGFLGSDQIDSSKVQVGTIRDCNGGSVNINHGNDED